MQISNEPLRNINNQIIEHLCLHSKDFLYASRTYERSRSKFVAFLWEIVTWYIFGSIRCASGELARAICLSEPSRAKIRTAKSNEPDMPPKRTKNVRIGVYRTQIQPSDHDIIGTPSQWLRALPIRTNVPAEIFSSWLDSSFQMQVSARKYEIKINCGLSAFYLLWGCSTNLQLKYINYVLGEDDDINFIVGI